MKKILTILILSGFLVISCFSVLAQGPPEKCTLNKAIPGLEKECPAGDLEVEKYGMCCLLNTIYNITNWIFIFLVALAGVFVIIGAMTILTAAGDPNKVSSGRGYIMYAMVGLLIAFLARAVPGIVKMMAGF